MHSLSFSLTVAFLSLFIYVNGSINDFDTNSPSGEGCVDTTGFLECFKAQESSFIDCGTFCNTAESLQNRNYNDCIVGCGETRAAANIGCWIQSCWSQVYSCEYQLTAINYLSTIDRSRSPVPFYPAPDGASGACSCNMGYVYGNYSYIEMGNPCIDAATSLDQNALDDCTCCEHALMPSNIITACPNSDLTFIGISDIIAGAQSGLSDSTKCSVLNTNPSLCTSTYNFPYTNNTVLNPLDLPAGEPGTEPLSNLPGNAFTEAGTDLVTVTFFGYTTTISPAAFNTKAGAVTGTAGSGATTTGSSSGKSITTATGSAAGATKTSGAGRLVGKTLTFVGVVGLAGMILAI